MNLTTSIEAHLALRVIPQSETLGWQDDPRESFDIAPLPAEYSNVLRDRE
jgi:hypothetical protein